MLPLSPCPVESPELKESTKKKKTSLTYSEDKYSIQSMQWTRGKLYLNNMRALRKDQQWTM